MKDISNQLDIIMIAKCYMGMFSFSVSRPSFTERNYTTVHILLI